MKIDIHNNKLLEAEDVSSSDSDSDSNSEVVDSNANKSIGDNLKLIERQTKTPTRKIPNVRSLETMQKDFRLIDAMHFCKSGIEVRYRVDNFFHVVL